MARAPSKGSSAILTLPNAISFARILLIPVFAVLIRGLFPLGAALLILVRDAAVLIVGTALMLTRRVRVDVRFVGKSATFGLMLGVPLVAWGNPGFAFEHAALALGWTCYTVAIVQ